MTKLMLILGFKQCKSNTSIYYFIDKKTKKLIIVIVYINDVCFISSKDSFVVATTRQNGTRSLLTSAKLSDGYLVVGIYKRTRQGTLAALLLYLYKLHVVRATTILTCPYVHASSCPITHPHVFSLRLPCFLHMP